MFSKWTNIDVDYCLPKQLYIWQSSYFNCTANWAVKQLASGDSDIQEYLNNSNQVIGENMETIIYRSVWKDKNKVKEAKNGRYLKEKKLRWTCLKIHFLYYCYYYLRRSCFEIRFKAREWNFVFVFRNGRFQVSKISGTSRR